MKFIDTYVKRFVPSAIRRQGTKFISKKMRRYALRLLLPVRCPTCRMFTRQRVGSVTGFRWCLSCGKEFTMTAVRRQCRIDGVRGARN